MQSVILIRVYLLTSVFMTPAYVPGSPLASQRWRDGQECYEAVPDVAGWFLATSGKRPALAQKGMSSSYRRDAPPHGPGTLLSARRGNRCRVSDASFRIARHTAAIQRSW